MEPPPLPLPLQPVDPRVLVALVPCRRRTRLRGRCLPETGQHSQCLLMSQRPERIDSPPGGGLDGGLTFDLGGESSGIDRFALHVDLPGCGGTVYLACPWGSAGS